MSTTEIPAINTNSVPANLPKLNECFIEVRVKIHAPSLVRVNNLAKEIVEKHLGTKAKFQTASKKLLNYKPLRDIANLAMAMRKFQAEHFIRLGNIEVVSTKDFLAVKEYFDEKTAEFERLVGIAAEKLDEMINEDRENLGASFDENVYPSEREIRNSFGIEFSIHPLPDYSNVNLKHVEKEKVAEIISTMQNSIVESAKQMQREILQKLLLGRDPSTNGGNGNGLHYAISRLADTDSRFRKNTLENVVAIAKLVKDLNSFEDPRINKLADDLINIFDVDSEIVRGDENVRDRIVKEAKKKVAEIEKTMDDLLL